MDNQTRQLSSTACEAYLINNDFSNYIVVEILFFSYFLPVLTVSITRQWCNVGIGYKRAISFGEMQIIILINIQNFLN